MGFPDVSDFSVVFATRARFKNKDVIVYTDLMHHSEVLERPQDPSSTQNEFYTRES